MCESSLQRFPAIVSMAAAMAFLATVPLSAAWPPGVPGSVELTVRETGGVARTNEVARQGVPLPRSLDVRSTAGLAVVNATGTAVPAQFRILARWHAALTDTTAPVQWVLVTFPATVVANGSTVYRLVTNGSVTNPAPAQPLTLNQAGNEVTVDTGAASFRFGGSAAMLFQEVRRAGTLLVSGSSMTARVNTTDTAHSVTRRVFVEEQGPLAAVVVVEGAYDMPPVGEGGMGSRRRYVFTAGSPTAIVRHSVAWEGALCAAELLECGGGVVNGVRVREAQDALTVTLGTTTPAATAVGAFAQAAVAGTVGAGQTASVRQLTRATRTAPLAFTASVPGQAGASGAKADGGMLALSGPAGAVAIALDHMHRYEPQAVSVLADGRMAVRLADSDAWLANHQGLFATMAVSALPSGVTRAELDRQVWAPLNRPLRPWPSARWFAASQAVEELPVGALPPGLASYDAYVRRVLDLTLTDVDALGTNGLMTYGLYPSIWGNPVLGDQMDCGADPTPAESFDNAFWCATWTDYHSAAVITPNRVMRTGEVDLLDELSEPAALRMLHTQILQCAPDDPFFYCGQAPGGNGGYRSNYNSSHQYWDNLAMYYWYTGDTVVTDVLERGLRTYRQYICPTRPAQSCGPDQPPADEFAVFTGRVANQFFVAYRLVGLALDASYLVDWRDAIARAVTQCYVEAVANGVTYGFWLDNPRGAAGAQHTTGQLWMLSEFDMNMLHRWQVDTGDQPIGNPAITASRVQAAWARTLVRYGSTVAEGGNGTAAGAWPNQIDFTWTGDRLGGTLATIAANTTFGSDLFLYNANKPLLTAVLARAGDLDGDASLRQMAADLSALGIVTGDVGGEDYAPLGKIQAEHHVRLGSAVARVSLQRSAVDFDGDVRADLTVYHPASGLWYVRRSGTGTVDAIAHGGAQYTPVPGDYENDARTRVAVYHTPSGLWFLRSPAGAVTGTGFGGTGYDPVRGDFDGDLRTDLAVFHPGSGLWFVRNSSDQSLTTVGYGATGYTTVPADYDGDRRTDLGVYHPPTGLWFVRQSTTSQTVTVGFGGPGYRPLRGDFDGDARADIAAFHEPSGLWFVRSSRDQSVTATGYGGAGYVPVPEDYDADGLTDLAVYHPPTGTWFVRSSASGATTATGFGGTGFNPVN